MTQCTICFNPFTEAGSSLWCEYCFYGESLVFPGRLAQASATVGMQEATFWASTVGKVIAQEYLKILDQVCDSTEISVLEMFCGVGGILKAIEPHIKRCAGYEPLTEVFGRGMSLLGTNDLIESTLPSVSGLDVLCLFNEFTALGRPEKVLTLLSPHTVVVECLVFDGKPQEMPFWYGADPKKHERYYSTKALERLFETQRYTKTHIFPAITGTYTEREEGRDLKIYVFESTQK